MRSLFERTQEQAFKDGLTGLANPRALQFQVARELGRARRTASPFSLILLDLDDFKIINDEYGHLAGDRALQEVARVLQQTTRPYDTCIRYGGDEFVVLLSSCGPPEAEERRRRVAGSCCGHLAAGGGWPRNRLARERRRQRVS